MYSLRPGKDAICGTEVKTATKQNYALYPYFLCLPLSAKRTTHEDQRFHSLPMGHAALAQATWHGSVQNFLSRTTASLYLYQV
jgi:hypothetical protein